MLGRRKSANLDRFNMLVVAEAATRRSPADRTVLNPRIAKSIPNVARRDDGELDQPRWDLRA
jgi:hypothetical protein